MTEEEKVKAEKDALEKVKAAAKTAAEAAVKVAKEENERALKAQKDAFDLIIVDLKKANKDTQDHADELDVKLQSRGEGGVKSFVERLADAIEGVKEELTALSTTKTGTVRLDTKVVGPITSASFGIGVNQGHREAGVNEKAYNKRFIFSLIDTMRGGADSNPLSWVEKKPKDGTAAWTAENATKPGMDWVWNAAEVTAKTLAVTSVVTKQAVQNRSILLNEIRSGLMKELYDVLDKSVIGGTGLGEEINGISKYATPFAAGNFAAKILDANDFDVLRVAVGRVYKANFSATQIVVSVDKATEMDLEKSPTNGHYVLPPFTSANGTVIKGVPVIATNFIGDDEFYVGDFSKYLFNIVEDATIDVGHVNDQFIKNQFTIRLEMAGMGRVKFHDTLAFVKGTFTTAKAAINKPAA